MAITILTNTAADPKSFAKPDNGCISKPIRSTTASIAVFTISVNIMNSTAMISMSCSFSVILNKKVTGIDNTSNSNSCLNAASFIRSHLNALVEFNVARYTRLRPFGLFSLSNTD